MRAAIYTRISKDLRDGAGVARQEKACRELAKAKGYEVVQVLSDNDLSAFSNKRRPQYEQLLELARQGQIEAIVCLHTDRLYRQLTDLDNITAACNAHKVKVETVQSGGVDLNSATGRMIAGMLAAQSRFEVDHQIERQKAAHADRAARGQFRGGPVTFGFQTVPGKPGHLAHNPEQAAAVRYAADAIIEGKSLQSIARRWLNMGVVAKGTQTPWSAAKVRKRMSSPRIAGLEPYKGQTYPATTYEAIISESKWRQVMAVLQENKPLNTRGSERRWLGTGIYICGLCGGTMKTIKRKRDSESARAYSCATCTRISRLVHKVDNIVESVVLGYLDLPENRLSLAQRETDDGGSLQELIDEQRELELRKNELAVMFAEGSLSAGQLTASTEKINQSSAILAGQISELQTNNPLASLILKGDDLTERWGKLSPAQKAKVVDSLVTVTILPAKRGGSFDHEAIKIERKRYL